MKKTIILIAALFMTAITYGQNSKINSAKSALESGDLQSALADIQAASEHKKTVDNPETWATMAMIYSQIQSSGINQILQIENLDEKISSSLDKAVSLDSNGDYAEIIQIASSRLMQNAHDAGAAAYEDDKDFQTAIDMFSNKLALQEKYAPNTPEDTIAYVVIASSYSNLDQPEQAITYYEKAYNLGYDEKFVYAGMINYYRDKDDDKYLNIVEEARAKYPEDQSYLLEEIDYYLSQGRIEEKLDELHLAFENNPENINLPIIISNIYQNKKDYAKQAEWTEKALAIDSENEIANLNTGVAYLNQASNIHNEMAAMPTANSQEFKDKEVLRDQKAEKAKQYLDKTLAINADNKLAIQALAEYYRMYENDAKIDEMLERLAQ